MDSDFEADVLKQGLTEEQAFALEKRTIKKYGRKDIGTGILVNRTSGGQGVGGAIFSEEHRKNLSISHTGKVAPPEVRKKMSMSHTGKVRSEEHKRNLSISLKKRGLTQEERDRLTEASRRACQTPEYRAKMSKIMLAKGFRHSPETKQLLSEIGLGRKHSEQEKTNMQKAWVKRRMTHQYKTDIVGKCLECGAPTKYSKKYCSRACYNKSRQTKKGSGIPERVCKHCGILFRTYSANKYCSHKCYGLAITGIPKSEIVKYSG
jgi:hypothetical protein